MSAFVIAEAGVNHNGSVKLAHDLVDAAADAGADAVKFQTFKTGSVISQAAPKAVYQTATGPEGESQFEMIRKLELPFTVWKELADHCRQRKIQFLSTPFDPDSLALLVEDLQMPIVKIGSGEITNAPFLLEISKTGLPVILSTGMSTLADVEAALGVLAFGWTGCSDTPGSEAFLRARMGDEGAAALHEKLTLLHCVTEYPTPFDAVNLRAMETLRNAFDVPVGYSDHTLGWAVPVAAVALGATVIEKHFTLDNDMEGPDHQASLEPEALAQMVAAIRQVESSLGSGVKAPSRVEWGNRVIARRGLVVTRPLSAGHVLTEADLTAKRPATGLPPAAYWSSIGRRLTKDKQTEMPLFAEDLA